MILHLSRYLAGLLAVYQVSNTSGSSMFSGSLDSVGRKCGAPTPTENDVAQSNKAVETWLRTPGPQRIQSVTVPTVFHEIRDGSTGSFTDKEITDSIKVLNEGFGPSFKFELIAQTDTNNGDWYTDIGSEYNMKSALRKGGCDTLNIYSTSGYGYLGFAYFPNSCQDSSYNKITDGVVIASSSKPGGNFPYDEGKTLTHEVGHWLGLYHTFENGCSAPGDSVSDTPAVAEPNYGCPTNTDSCKNDGQGNDLINNFMDYTNDACMDAFTPKQFERMLAQWDSFRAGTGEPTPPTPNPPTPNPPTPNPPTPNPPTPNPPTNTYDDDSTMDDYYDDSNMDDYYDTCMDEFEFLEKFNKKKKKITTRECSWLALRPEKWQKYCTKKWMYKLDPKTNIVYTPPYKACPMTCHSCYYCNEEPKFKFFYKMKKNKSLLKNCKWLGKQKLNKKNDICSSNDSDGVYPAANVICPMTCETNGCDYYYYVRN